MDRTRFSRIASQFRLVQRCALALFVTAILGCGEYKPPKFGDIVDSVKGTEKTETKKETPKPAQPAAQQAAAQNAVATAPNAAPAIGSSDRPGAPVAGVTRKPEEVIAEFDAKGSVLTNDASIKGLLDSLGGHPDLVTKIDLTDGQATPAGYELLLKCKKLADLNLTRAQQTSEGWEAVGKLTSLEKLNGTQAHITDADMANVCNLTKLKELIASKNIDISDEGIAYLAALKQLEVLDISQCGRVTGSGFAEARKRGGMGPLRVLIANHTKFGKVGMNSLNGLGSLENLDVAAAEVMNPSMGGLRSCPKLKRLILNENSGITNGGAVELSRLKQLEWLELHNLNHLGDEGLSQVKNAKKLEFVNVDGTAVTTGGLRGLKRMIPNVKIQWQGKNYE